MTEAQLQSLIVELMQKSGWFAFVVSRPDRRTTAKKGLPDIWAGKKGRSLWIETKIDKNKLSAEQAKFRDDCAYHGIEWHEVRGLADVVEIMNRR